MNENSIIIESLRPYLSVVKKWIIDYVEENKPEAKNVSEFGFSRLPYYYPKKILDTAKVVIVDKVIMIPLSQLGIQGFDDFENLDAAGVTYLNTYFVSRKYANLESIHFHELVHISQWYYLGIDTFLLLYGLGLKKYGYKLSPLEAQAYKLQECFEKSIDHFDVELQIISSLKHTIKENF